MQGKYILVNSKSMPIYGIINFNRGDRTIFISISIFKFCSRWWTMRIRVTKDNFIMENKSCLHFHVRCLNGLRAKQINYSPFESTGMENGIKIFKRIFNLPIYIYISFMGYRVKGRVNDNHSPICRKRRTSFYYIRSLCRKTS